VVAVTGALAVPVVAAASPSGPGTNSTPVAPAPTPRVGSRGRLSRDAAVTGHHLQTFSAPTSPYRGSLTQALALAAAGATLPMWQQTESYPSGNPYTYTMVGTSPFNAGAGTTTLTAPIIPIKFVSSSGPVLSDASAVASDCFQLRSPVGLTQISPMFQNQVPDPEGNQTQWIDALQRGNFNQQTKAGGVSPNYHLLLSATTPAGVTITVPSADIYTHAGASCGTSTGISMSWFQSIFPTEVASLVSSGEIQPTQFPLFVMYNTYFCNLATCSQGGALGYHDKVSTPSGLQIYGIYDYDLTGTFLSHDTAIMSHELAEAINDPLGTNPVPTWGYIGQDPQSCQTNLEPGDPLSVGYPGSPSTVTDTYLFGGLSYVFNLQDMAYHSWFYRESSPPTSVEVANILGTGAYSLFGTFTGPSNATVCPGQPTGVHATPGNTQATVSWTAGPGPISAYVVIPYIGTTQQTPQAFSSTATTETVTGLTNGTAYTFTVRAAHTNASSGFDVSTESLPTSALVIGAPTAPTKPKATAGTGSATVTWIAPATDNGSPITGYVITPFVNGVAEPPKTYTSTALSEVVTGLQKGKSYAFEIAAANAHGTGPNSIMSNAVSPK
jgi:hypothetical protein